MSFALKPSHPAAALYLCNEDGYISLDCDTYTRLPKPDLTVLEWRSSDAQDRRGGGASLTLHVKIFDLRPAVRG